MKLRTKNFLFTTIMIMVVVTLAFTALYAIMPSYYRAQKEQEIEQKATEIKQLLAESPDFSEEIAQKLDKIVQETNMTIYLESQSKQPLYPKINEQPIFTENKSNQDQKISDEQIQGEDAKDLQTNSNKSIAVSTNDSGEAILVPDDSDFINVWKTVKDETNKPYRLSILYPIQPIDDAKSVLLGIYPWILSAALIIGTIGAFGYSYYSTKKINQIIENTQKMTKLKGAPLNNEMGQDEIGTLAKNINYLYSSLLTTITHLDQEIATVSEVERSKAEFMRIASHELKTPITALKGVIEGMIYNVGDFQDHDKYLRICQDILNEQRDLVQDILLISKLDMLGIQVESATFSVTEIVEENVAMYDLLAKTDHYRLIKQVEPVNIYGQAADFKRIYANLMSNALNYTTAQGDIKIVLTAEYLRIENTCEPLPEEELSKIFDAFYRPDFARNRSAGGSGLGLFIVGQLLERNHWQYDFRPSADQTSMVFEIMF